MKYAIFAIVLLLSGCAEILGNSPTFQYCDSVQYIRKGNMVDITAHCALPIGGGTLPIPGAP